MFLPTVDLPLSSSSSDSGKLSQDNPVDSWEDIADNGVTVTQNNIKDSSPPQQPKMTSSKTVKSIDSEWKRKNPLTKSIREDFKGKVIN